MVIKYKKKKTGHTSSTFTNILTLHPLSQHYKLHAL